jgi:hypothetical protein
MPLNKMHRGVTPAATAGPALCQTPRCQKVALKGGRFCSMCTAKIQSGMDPSKRKKKPAESTPK